MNTRVVFMGSPDFALPTLQALINNIKVVGVVTQPDRPAGRGREIKPPPIKILAERYNLPLIQPIRLREPQIMQQINNWEPELIVVAAFGQILRQDILNIPIYGCINVHASLLPRWRGAAPIQAAILNGDSSTGVTIMLMDSGIDTGAIICQRSLAILPEDNSGSLNIRLANFGAGLLMDTLPEYINGNIQPHPQPDVNITYAPLLEKKDGLLDFGLSAIRLTQCVRAYNPWPGAYTIIHGKVIKIHHAHPILGIYAECSRPTIIQGLPAIGTVDGLLVLDEVQIPGKKPVPGKVFLSGVRDWSES